MVASRASTYPNSAQFYVKNGDAEGFADVRSCVTTDGYGYNGRGAQACDVGTYNGKDNWDSCKPCPYGYTTAGLGRGVSLASCGVAAGFGYSVQQQSVVPCPMGESISCAILLALHRVSVLVLATVVLTASQHQASQ
jgi:hypothetical protein